MASKSKLFLRMSTYSINGSIIVTVEVEDSEKVVPTTASMSISGDPSTVLNFVISKLRS